MDEVRRLQENWPRGKPADHGQAYAGPADVAVLMFEERLETKEPALKR